jgi:hypothetical protein
MDDRFIKLREALLKEKKWPMEYLFKFIVPNEQVLIDDVKEVFTNPDNIKYKVSQNIKYVGITCKELMPDVDSIISIYEKAAKIKGVISI